MPSSNVFNLKINIKSLVDSPQKDEVPHEELDKWLQLHIKSKKHFKLSLTQQVYSYFLR
jgi:hypothetical protein